LSISSCITPGVAATGKWRNHVALAVAPSVSTSRSPSRRRHRSGVSKGATRRAVSRRAASRGRADQGLLDHRQARADQAQLVQPGAGQMEQQDGPVLGHGLGCQPLAEPVQVGGRG
jgi:hypothetical protein